MVKASLIWLNYNSSGFIDIALRSIESALRLDFDDYEVVIVDNASGDGSFERIRKFIEEKKPSNVRVKFVRSDANRGYAGGMNLGWKARDPETKYAAFLNNDLILEPNSLRELINYMEGDDKIAVASGLTYIGDGRRIFSAGGYITDHWYFGSICWDSFEHECPGINKPHYVTYASGEYMVVKTEIIKRVCPDGKPFIDETFLYLDDNLLGLILWNRGYRAVYVPVKSGIHYASLTTGPSKTGLYYGKRATTIGINVMSTKLTYIRQLYIARRLVGYRLLSLINRRRREEYSMILRAVRDGLKLSPIIERRVGILDLKKAPHVHVNTIDALLELLQIKKIGRVNHEMLKQPETR
jgi:GT2 family glycosyltransferase